MLKLAVILSLFSASAAFATNCFSEGSGKKISFYMEETQPNKDYFEDMSMAVNIVITHLYGKDVVKSFLATGTRGMMAAGEMTELENKAEQFSYQEGYNGSELNGWVVPETIVYQGTIYGSCKD